MKNKKLKIGIVGCGAIGASLSLMVKEKFGKRIEIAALCDIDKVKAQGLKSNLGCGKVASLKELIQLSDLIVEAASAKISFDIAKQALLKKKDVLIMSVGGVLGREKELFKISEKNKKKIYFPSGAICGLDGVRALTLAGIDEITLKTLKPPKALEGADYIVNNNIELNKITKEKVIFSGTAQEAVKAFPQNINVVAVLSLAAQGQVVPRVKILAVPGLKRNVHIIEIKSCAANLEIKCENVPSPDNPKTSYLAVLSAVAVLQQMTEQIEVGS